MNRTRRILFEREDIIGRGAFGKVFRGTLTTKDGIKVEVAVKQIWRNWSAKKIENDRELTQLLLDHPNVVKLLHWEDHGEDFRYEIHKNGSLE